MLFETQPFVCGSWPVITQLRLGVHNGLRDQTLVEHHALRSQTVHRRDAVRRVAVGGHGVPTLLIGPQEQQIGLSPALRDERNAAAMESSSRRLSMIDKVYVL